MISERICPEGATSLSQLGEDEGARCLAAHSTCAVVGSSANLLDMEQGEAIDAHDVVVRMNAAPVGTGNLAHIAKHVGAKVDVRFTNQYGLLPDGDTEDACLFIHEPDMECAEAKDCWWSPEACSAPCDATCRGYDQRHSVVDWGQRAVILDNVHAAVAIDIVGQWRTSGFVALTYALMTCETVDVYGFGPSCEGAYTELADRGSRACRGLEPAEKNISEAGWHKGPTKTAALAACQKACDDDDDCRFLVFYDGLGCRTFDTCEDPVDDPPLINKHIYARTVGDRYYEASKPVFADHSYIKELSIIGKAAREGPEKIFPESRLGDLKATTLRLVRPECTSD